MQVFLIEDKNKGNYLKKAIKIKEDKIILNRNIQKMNLKGKIAITQKISKIIKNNNSNKVIISKELKKDTQFVDLLYSNEIDIIQGKYLFKVLINKIIDNLCDKNNIKKEEKQIAIVVNDLESIEFKSIEELASKFKILNIVTKRQNGFNNIKEKLFEEKGVIITITNNKKKALSKSDIIINVDVPEEIINKYVIYDNAIIINLEENIKIKKKRFNGKIINDYKITLKEETDIALELKKDKYQNYDLQDLTEIFIINNPKEIENIIISK